MYAMHIYTRGITGQAIIIQQLAQVGFYKD
jgi:hypothetical protein